LHFPARVIVFSVGAEQKKWIEQEVVFEIDGSKHSGMPGKNQA